MKQINIDFNSKREYENFKNIIIYAKSKIKKENYRKQRPIIGSNLPNKNKIIFCIKDLLKIAPHSKFVKMQAIEDTQCKQLFKSQKKFVFFFLERKKQSKTLFWLNSFPIGPVVQLSIDSISSSRNFYFLGNCKKWSLSILSFDKNFTNKPHLNLIKKIFTEFFSSKRNNIKAEPFLDHVVSFCFYNSNIWIRIYQITISKNFNKNNLSRLENLIEIGPRLNFNVSKIWSDLKKKNLIYNSKSFKTKLK
ncbi:ribosome biogenesis protein BRX1 (nucleomorph) [Chroomonas mesostigmatica CCMP1168]|uniref:Ribosome biogenesis protein BRX1 n=1 Tax=Chroomonas mesostigmatica CCMP1168 TaxID=1195612 RepID=J7G1J3_9CRYP|nr:ribosome biogenesis protein BRX1 [Chroomonas mesostigmatica CCMP1168]